MQDSGSGRSFSVASYNIHQCVGTDGRRDAERIAAVIRDLDCDAIGLQEVDSRAGPHADSMQLGYLACATGMDALAGPTILRHDGDYGNALLSMPLVAAGGVSREPRTSRGPGNRAGTFLDLTDQCAAVAVLTRSGFDQRNDG